METDCSNIQIPSLILQMK